MKPKPPPTPPKKPMPRAAKKPTLLDTDLLEALGALEREIDYAYMAYFGLERRIAVMTKPARWVQPLAPPEVHANPLVNQVRAIGARLAALTARIHDLHERVQV